MKTKTTTLVIISVLFWLAAVQTAVAQEAAPAVGWSLEFSTPAAVSALPPSIFYDGKSRQNVQGRSTVSHSGDAIRITAVYGWGTKNHGDYVQLELPMPAPVDLSRFPIIEVEWRTDVPAPAECLNISGQTQNSAGDSSTSSFYIPGGKTGEWTTSTYQYVPDVTTPTRSTPIKLTGLTLRTFAGAAVGEFSVEVRAIRLRAMNQAETLADTQREVVFKEALKNSSVRKPNPLKIFPFGWAGVCRGPEKLESWYDTVVRRHANYSAYHFSQSEDWRGWNEILPVEEYIKFRKQELAPASVRGLYIQPVLPLAGVLNGKSPENLDWVQGYAQSLAEAFRTEPYLAGWSIADEVSDDWLWSVAAVADALGEADAAKAAVANQFSINRMLRFEPYLSVLMTEVYPIRKASRDPWLVGRWCREVSRRSDKPHWVFLQAMGGAEWFSSDTDFAMPTGPEVRLMSYLALANGAKGIAYFCYSATDLYAASFSPIGNPLPLSDPLSDYISPIGARVAEIGPLLLDTKLLPKTSAWTQAMTKGEKAVTVGVRRNTGNSSFIVAANESLSQPSSATVYLGKDLVSKGRAVYDLYSLRLVAALGSRSFQTVTLSPGDGRIYVVASPKQFEALRRQIMRNRALETLRVAELDRLVAQRWGVDTKTADAAVKKATQRAEWGDTRSADEARLSIAGLFKAGSDIAECRKVLSEIKAALGIAYYEARTAYDKAVPGCERLVSSLHDPQPDTIEALWHRFALLQEDYFLGKWENLIDSLTLLSKDAQRMLERVRIAKETKQS